MFEILSGLPATGPYPEQFSATGLGKHREGLVVRFGPLLGGPWVGNFQPGLGRYDDVLPHPDGQQVVVIAGGQGYIVDPETRQVRQYIRGQINNVCRTYEPSLLILDQSGVSFVAIGPSGTMWETCRLSWDGFRGIRIEGDRLTGEAWSPMDDRWHTFAVVLATGQATGGSFR